MADQNGGSQEPVSYDADLRADIMGAVSELSKPETPVVEEKTPEPVKEAETEQQKADRVRDEQGRFAKADEKPAPKVEAKAPEIKPAEQKPVEAAKPTEQQTTTIPGNPPPGWSVKSKSEWDKLSENVRADIAKREQEVSNGFAEYSGMKELRPYVEMARSQGTTLKAALDNYTGIENMLRQNTVKGILHIAGNVGYTPQRLVMELSQALGIPSTGTDPAQTGSQPPAVDQTYIQQLLTPLTQRLEGMQSLFQKQQDADKARQMTAINTVLDRFISDPQHRYYHSVEAEMVRLLDSGIVHRSGDYATDLKAAYDLACRMHPEISEALFSERITKTEEARRNTEKEAAEKAKQASRSITGSPSTGVNKNDTGNDDDSVEADVRRAVRAHAA